MATTSPTPPPTLENRFYLNIGHEYERQPGLPNPVVRWENPHLGSAITPYVPTDSFNFVPTFQPENFDHDVTVIVLSNLDLKNLINCSTICKSFHSAVKSDFIWRVQLCNFLPNVTFIAPNLCIFTPEQQFKIIFKRMLNECKPYLAKFNRNQELGIAWHNELKTLEFQYQKAGGETAATRHGKKFFEIDMELPTGLYIKQVDVNQLMAANGEPSSDVLAYELRLKIGSVNQHLECLSGADFDGTIQFIGPNSSQGQLMTAINVLVPNAFDNQVKFEEEIRKSETTKNTSSSNSDGPIIEEVADVTEPKSTNPT